MTKSKSSKWYETFFGGLYTAPQMRRLLRKAGFRDVRFFGRSPLGRFTRHSPRMIAVGTKPVK
jgi:hypothetical protein